MRKEIAEVFKDICGLRPIVFRRINSYLGDTFYNCDNGIPWVSVDPNLYYSWRNEFVELEMLGLIKIDDDIKYHINTPCTIVFGERIFDVKSVGKELILDGHIRLTVAGKYLTRFIEYETIDEHIKSLERNLEVEFEETFDARVIKDENGKIRLIPTMK